MATKLTELRNGCFHAALDDEPMFVLLARDPDAPRLCRNWASQRESEITRGARPSSDTAKVIHARQLADDMEKWRKANDGAWRNGEAVIPGLLDGTAVVPATTLIGHHVTAAAECEDGSIEWIEISGKRYHLDMRELVDSSPVMQPKHHVRQESDEYACSCGRRWDVADGEDHP